jgi:hypothetical protein
MVKNLQGWKCRVCGEVLVQHDHRGQPEGPMVCPKAPSGHKTPGTQYVPRQVEAFRRSGVVGTQSIATRIIERS